MLVGSSSLMDISSSFFNTNYLSTSVPLCSIPDVNACSLECENSCIMSCSLMCLPSCSSMCSNMCSNICTHSGEFGYNISSTCVAVSSTYVDLDSVPQLLFRFPESSFSGEITKIYAKISNFLCVSLDDVRVSALSLESHVPLMIFESQLGFSNPNELAVNLSMSGSNIVPGMIQFSVFCTSRIRTMVMFNFTILDSPAQVVQLQIVGSLPITDGYLRLGISTTQTILITVKHMPANLKKDDFKVELQGFNLFIESLKYDPQLQLTTISITSPQQQLPGLKYGIVVFGKNNSECNTSCCEKQSCAMTRGCDNIKTACFQLEYFDDLIPQISSFSSTLSG